MPEQIAEELTRLPTTLQLDQHISAYDLVARSGYLEHHVAISESVIRTRLALAPELVEAWIGFSADKRVGKGWYFQSAGKDEYEVGFLAGREGKGQVKTYKDKFEALREIHQGRAGRDSGCVRVNSIWSSRRCRQTQT